MPGRNAAKILVAREALLAKSNEHVLLDTAGIIGFFATITVVVDFAGHYSDDILKKTEMMVQSSVFGSALLPSSSALINETVGCDMSEQLRSALL